MATEYLLNDDEEGPVGGGGSNPKPDPKDPEVEENEENN